MDNESGLSASKKMRRDLSREKEELRNTASRDQLVEKILRQQQEIDALLAKQASESCLDELRESVEKMKLQVIESNRQENMLMKRLAAKEREVQELLVQISDLKQAMNPSSAQLQSMLLDPAINLLYVQMKREMDSIRSQLEQSQKDLAAWKFTPDSQTGKRLMAKCRMLLQENEELGRTVSTGKLAKLEGDIALQKRLISEMKNSEKDTEEFLGDVDEDLEAMQGTVYLLQQELKEAKDCISAQQLEIDQLRESTMIRPESAVGMKNSIHSLPVECVHKTPLDSKAQSVDFRTRSEQNCPPIAREEKDMDKTAKLFCNKPMLQQASNSDSLSTVEDMEVGSAADIRDSHNAASRLPPASAVDENAVHCIAAGTLEDGLVRTVEGLDKTRTVVVKLEPGFVLTNGTNEESAN